MISPGLLTTVQDLGRPGYAHLGISASGAADALSMRAGNLLVGNREGAAALEMTLAGGTFEFESAAVVAITGGDFEANVPLWAATEVKSGERVRCGHARTGARAYLCVRGGIDVPLVLGSASTHLLTGIGGFEGRGLKRGDVISVGCVGQALSLRQPPKAKGAFPAPPLRAGTLAIEAARGARFAGFLESPPPRDQIRVTGSDALCGAVWRVKEDSDRMGLRLCGPALAGLTGQMLTEGVPLGAVQIPPDGQPIILFVEHQTTGGYPKAGNVISADFHAVGQLRPRDEVRFERVSIEAALKLLRAQEAWLRGLV